MKYHVLLFCFIACNFTCKNLLAQDFPMKASHWDINEEQMEFGTYEGRENLHIKGQGEAFIKNLDFEVGTIEFEFYPTEPRFCGIYFRRDDDQEKGPDFYSDFLYLRTFKLDDPFVPGAVQYAPITRGTNLWDIMHYYEGSALIKSATWNRIKLVVSEKQLQCYINDEMVLWIPELMGENGNGMVSIEGPGRYSRFKISKDDIGSLPNEAAADVTKHDVRYLSEWQRTEEMPFPPESSIFSLNYPDSTTSWQAISSERFGLINLTKHVSSPFMERERRMVWLRTSIDSDKQQEKELRLGFSDDVYIFINGDLLHMDKNTYRAPIMKQPTGRLHIENLSVDLPLIEGRNEILIALANDFFGWGLVAQLENMNGIVAKMQH